MQVVAAPMDNDWIPFMSLGSSTVTGKLTRSSMLWLPLLWWTHFGRMLTWLKLRINLKRLAQKQTEKIATAIIMMMTNWRQLLVRCRRKEKEFPTLRTLPPAFLKRLWGNITLVYNSHVKGWNCILSTMSISFSDPDISLDANEFCGHQPARKEFVFKLKVEAFQFCSCAPLRCLPCSLYVLWRQVTDCNVVHYSYLSIVFSGAMFTLCLCNTHFKKNQSWSIMTSMVHLSYSVLSYLSNMNKYEM